MRLCPLRRALNRDKRAAQRSEEIKIIVGQVESESARMDILAKAVLILIPNMKLTQRQIDLIFVFIDGILVGLFIGSLIMIFHK